MKQLIEESTQFSRFHKSGICFWNMFINFYSERMK